MSGPLRELDFITLDSLMPLLLYVLTLSLIHIYTLEKTRREIVDRCLDPKDPEYISLLDELKRVFKKKNIEELTADEMKQMMGNLNALKKKAEKRNLADRMLAAKYSGDAVSYTHLDVYKRQVYKWTSKLSKTARRD